MKKRHIFSGLIIGGIATAVSVVLLAPVDGREVVEEIEVDLEAKDRHHKLNEEKDA